MRDALGDGRAKAHVVNPRDLAVVSQRAAADAQRASKVRHVVGEPGLLAELKVKASEASDIEAARIFDSPVSRSSMPFLQLHCTAKVE